jgi:hypothetical protein
VSSTLAPKLNTSESSVAGALAGCCVASRYQYYATEMTRLDLKPPPLFCTV